MKIRKIIREEMDDFQWIKDIGFPETLTFNREAHLQAGKDTFGPVGSRQTTHHQNW